MIDTDLAERIKRLLPHLENTTHKPPDVHQTIRYLLTVLQNDAIREFFLNKPSFSSVSYLTSKEHLQKAESYQTRRALFSPPTFSLYQTFLRECIHIFLPVFTVNNYIVGVAVRKRLGTAYKDLECTEQNLAIDAIDRVARLKFAFNLNDNTTTLWEDDDRCVVVNVHSVKSACFVRESILAFDRIKLESTWMKPGRQVDAHALRSCLQGYDTAQLLRNCPICYATPQHPCLCLKSSKSMARSNSSRQITPRPYPPSLQSAGALHGIRERHQFVNSALLQTTFLGEIMVVQELIDRDTVNAVLDRSVREWLHEQTYDPWRNVLTPAEETAGEKKQIGMASSSDEQQTLKKRLRVERNRECARRSNLRRKVENDTRKKQLRTLNDLKIKLQAKELQLRRENMALRKLLQNRGTASQDENQQSSCR